MKAESPARVRFGEFEFDPTSGELRRGNETAWLTEQPFRVLRILVEHSGGMVLREEIKKRLWPNDTVVDFEHGINAAVRILRRTLGDSADQPRYIETIARRGYRLIAPVEQLSVVSGQLSEPGAPPFSPAPGGSVGNALIGRTVSHYRVLDIIGGGGMGVVYRAEDLKLGRQVALKFLPEELGSEPQALERFSREARTASSLNHPNICYIHEFGEHEGQPFIAMELLEGQTLRDHIAADEPPKSLPQEDLLDIGIQVSEGLQAAHEKGIIHRDIEPANIFLTSKGVVKILDFGLAKMVEAPRFEAPDFSPATREEPSNLSSRAERVPHGGTSEVEGSAFTPALENAGPSTPRRPDPQEQRVGEEGRHSAQDDSIRNAQVTLSRTGLAMGTAGYMSPEQVRGEKLDARTDIFSFGLVLYEMSTGQRAFPGATAAVVHDAILNAAPVPVRQLNSTLSVKLAVTIDKALEKERERRYQSAADLRADLEPLRSRKRIMRDMDPQKLVATVERISRVVILAR
jgi:serine/threonine protein kinase